MDTSPIRACSAWALERSTLAGIFRAGHQRESDQRSQPVGRAPASGSDFEFRVREGPHVSAEHRADPRHRLECSRAKAYTSRANRAQLRLIVTFISEWV